MSGSNLMGSLDNPMRGTVAMCALHERMVSQALGDQVSPYGAAPWQ